jgi:hypothetical protein
VAAVVGAGVSLLLPVVVLLLVPAAAAVEGGGGGGAAGVGATRCRHSPVNMTCSRDMAREQHRGCAHRQHRGSEAYLGRGVSNHGAP